MRILCILCVLLLSSGCPRVFPEGRDPSVAVRGTHPWDSPEYKAPEVQPLPRADTQPASSGIELPAGHGPALPREDTLDAERISGKWLQVIIVNAEKIAILPVSEQDVMEFREGGYLVYHSTQEWKETIQEGRFKKLQPGVLGISFANEEYAPWYGQLYRQDFLYLWNYESRTGTWFARLPEKSSERISGGGAFSTNRGQLVFKEVVGQSFIATVEGLRPMTASGSYQRGIMTMRWEEADGTGGGWSMFVVDPDWQKLKGVWWIDDYEAAPFSGDWDGDAGTSTSGTGSV